MSKPRHLVIMAAGTGGHIMPGLAVAKELQSRGWTVSWLGTEDGMEHRLVPPAGIELDTISFKGLRGKGLGHAIKGAFLMLKAFIECFRILRKRQADAVLGMGGYVCFPGGLMAKLRGLPLVLVNADAAMLLSNRALAPITNIIAFGFDGPAAKGKRARVTGNPVRADIEAIAGPEQRFAGREGPLRILVVGGSLGARVLNEALPAALAQIPPGERPKVTHQTGMANFDAVKASYKRLDMDPVREVEVVPFINNMAHRLADCDLLVCRAGAITVSELCAAGVPSILVPLVLSTTSHQKDNAEYMAAHGAAVHLPQSDLNADNLAERLKGLTRAGLLDMAIKARALGRPRAAGAVADEIEQLVKTNAKGASA